MQLVAGKYGEQIQNRAMDKTLSDKQKAFVAEYLIDLNATAAAIRAGYSKRSAEVTANRLLRNAKIAREIERKAKDREKRTQITQDRVLEELAAISFVNASDFAEVIGGKVFIKDTADIPKAKLPAISSIKQTQNGVEIKLYDKTKSLELIGKHLGMFNGGETNIEALERLDAILKGVRDNAQLQQETE